MARLDFVFCAFAVRFWKGGDQNARHDVRQKIETETDVRRTSLDRRTDPLGTIGKVWRDNGRSRQQEEDGNKAHFIETVSISFNCLPGN
jgi:hypothetical protein